MPAGQQSIFIGMIVMLLWALIFGLALAIRGSDRAHSRATPA